MFSRNLLSRLQTTFPGSASAPQLETLRRFWIMLAHYQGDRLKVAQLAGNLGVDAKTAQRYIDLLCALLLHAESGCWNARPQ